MPTGLSSFLFLSIFLPVEQLQYCTPIRFAWVCQLSARVLDDLTIWFQVARRYPCWVSEASWLMIVIIVMSLWLAKLMFLFFFFGSPSYDGSILRSFCPMASTPGFGSQLARGSFCGTLECELSPVGMGGEYSCDLEFRWIYLVGGDWNMTGLFFHMLGISSSQVTHIFQRDWNHQPSYGFEILGSLTWCF